MEKKRLEFADALKGLAVLWIIVYHLIAPCTLKYPVDQLEEVFLMFFFFYSGYFHKPGKKSITKNIADRTKALVVPFFKYSLIFWGIGSIYLVLTKNETIKEAFACLRNFFIGCIWNRVIQDWFHLEYYSLGKRYYYLADFWFLIALYFSSLFFFLFIDKILKSKITVIITVVCLFAVTGILKFFDISLPYNFQLVPFWLAFMILGAFSAQIKLFFLPVKTSAKLAIGVGTLVTGVIIALIKPPASNLFRGSFGEKEVICLLLCTVAAITGVWGLSQIFVLLEEAGLRMKELAWVGSHSLVFYIFHMFLAWIICVITKFNVLYKEPLEKGTIPKSIGLTAAVIVLCILRCLAEDFIKKKYERKQC